MQRTKKEATLTISYALLEIIGVGGLVTLADILSQGRNGPRLLRCLAGYSHARIRKLIRQLKFRGLIEYDEQDEYSPILITEKGFIRKIKMDLRKQKWKKWDHLWRLIIFDIPESCRSRRAFQYLLRSVGCYKIQRSVYVYPEDRKKELLRMAASLRISKYVMIYTVPHLGPYEQAAREHYFRRQNS